METIFLSRVIEFTWNVSYSNARPWSYPKREKASMIMMKVNSPLTKTQEKEASRQALATFRKYVPCLFKKAIFEIAWHFQRMINFIFNNIDGFILLLSILFKIFFQPFPKLSKCFNVCEFRLSRWWSTCENSGASCRRSSTRGASPSIPWHWRFVVMVTRWCELVF